MANNRSPNSPVKPHPVSTGFQNTNPTKAFGKDRANGFGRGGGISPTLTQPSQEMDMMSVFTDDDVSVHTNLSTVEARLIDLQNANMEQNKIIAQQNAKIESMQKEHENQLESIRQEQAARPVLTN
jgi:hypothetical protein